MTRACIAITVVWVAGVAGCQTDSNTEALANALPGQRALADAMRVPADASVLTEGVVYRIKSPGHGNERADDNDSVQVRYRSWRADGTAFNRTGDKPLSLTLASSAPGWRATIQDMAAGEVRRVWMAPDKAFKKLTQRTPRELTVYEITLVAIDSVANMPAELANRSGAETTVDGLRYRFLQRAASADKPRPWDRVTVHMRAWDPGGRLVDDTYRSGVPKSFFLFERVRGLSLAVQLMSPGERLVAWLDDEMTRKPGAKGSRGELLVELELVSLDKRQQPPRVKPPLAVPQDALSLAKGIRYTVRDKGDGRRLQECVQLHYTNRTQDGELLDSSLVKGAPAWSALRAQGPLQHVQKVLGSLRVGGAARVWIPGKALDKDAPLSRDNTLVVDLDIVATKPQPQAPKFRRAWAQQPAAVQKRAGLDSLRLRAGTGKPIATQTVRLRVRRTLWGTHGRMLLSSHASCDDRWLGRKNLRRAFPVLAPGIETMAEGEQVVFWFNKPSRVGTPARTYVALVDLVAVE